MRTHYLNMTSHNISCIFKCIFILLIHLMIFVSIHASPLLRMFINKTGSIAINLCGYTNPHQENLTEIDLPNDVFSEWIYPLLYDPFYARNSVINNNAAYYFKVELWETFKDRIKSGIKANETCNDLKNYQKHRMAKAMHSFYAANQEIQYDALYRWYRKDSSVLQVLLSCDIVIDHPYFCDFLNELDSSGTLWSIVNSKPYWYPRSIYCGNPISECKHDRFDSNRCNLTWNQREHQENAAFPDIYI